MGEMKEFNYRLRKHGKFIELSDCVDYEHFISMTGIECHGLWPKLSCHLLNLLLRLCRCLFNIRIIHLSTIVDYDRQQLMPGLDSEKVR